MLKLNFFTSIIFIAGPLFLLVVFGTMNKARIELIKNEEMESLRKKGKRNFFIILSIIIIMWIFRITAFMIYKN